MTYSQAWLEDPTAVKGIFVEATVHDVVANTDITIYLSNVGYMTSDASVSYKPIIIGGGQFTESISMDTSISMSFGDIEIANPNGDYDSWLDYTQYIWVNRPIKVYLGDPLWVSTNITAIHSNFELIFNGLIADIDSKTRETLNIKVRDKLERLNTPISETLLGTHGTWAGGQPNAASLKPLIFGEVFNIAPMLIDPSILEYLVNDGNTESIIELRDNGVPIHTTYGTPVTGATLTLTSGSFVLLHALIGTLTASVQGVKNSINLTTGALISGTYNNNIANLVALITTQYGKTPLSASELDLTNLSAFSTAYTQAVGISIADKTNILTVCQELISSVGAQLYMTRKGLLQILKLGTPTSDTSVNISDNDILHHSLQLTNKSEVLAATLLGICRNWSVQNNLVTLIPEEHKTNFSTDWKTVTTEDTTVKSNYILSALPTQKDTALINEIEAQGVSDALNVFFKTPRFTYKFTGTSKLMSLKLGQPVILTHNRFGLSSGKSGQVISLSPNWLTSTIEIEVII